MNFFIVDWMLNFGIWNILYNFNVISWLALAWDFEFGTLEFGVALTNLQSHAMIL